MTTLPLDKNIKENYKVIQTNNLKPCPFCGCEMLLVQHGTNLYYEHPINNCFLSYADSEYERVWFCVTDRKAIEDWNTRTPQKIEHNSLCETETFKVEGDDVK